MHYVVCRATGIVVRGPAPTDLIGEVARSDVFGYLEAELRWACDNAPEAYGVLNACRALAYLDSGKILSKVDGARYALDQGGPPGLITAALAMQHGDQPHRPPTAPARRFLTEVGRRLHAQQL
jgi:streptomycin 3"-adenylyltransferase